MTSVKNGKPRGDFGGENFSVFPVFTTRRVMSGADSRHAGKNPRSPYAGEFLLDLEQPFLTYLR